MRFEPWHWSLIVIPGLVLLHLWVSPFTKVEESFNVQATHDILKNGVPSPFEKYPAFKFMHQYDHMTFPGAVPRTFVGALILSGITQPILWYRHLPLPDQQILVRAILGLLSAGALLLYIHGVRRAYGKSTAGWFTLLVASQFHIYYYASRTLPNMFAFAISTTALSFFLPLPGAPPVTLARRNRGSLYLLTLATIIFRSELALLLFANSAQLLVFFPVSTWWFAIRRTILPAVLGGLLAGLTLTITIDTYFWRPDSFPAFLNNPLWPELTAFLANIFPEKGTGASEWGTSPWHWYFSSALPRLLLNPLSQGLLTYVLLTPRRKDALTLIFPAYLYIALYSFLPHKETRFLFPILPQITLVTALGASQLDIAALRSHTARLAKYLIIGSTLITAMIAHGVLLPLSALSYPGAHALASLHDIAATFPPQRQIDVHLTNLALQTGVTRFLEKPVPSSPLVILPGSADGRYPPIRTGATLWQYDKSDNSTGVYNDIAFWDKFDYAVVEDPNYALPVGGWDIVDRIAGPARPTLLGPGTGSGLLVFGDSKTRREVDGFQKMLEAMYGRIIGSKLGRIYGIVHDIVREGYGVPGRQSLTRGYWIHWGLEWKLYVLKRAVR